LIETGTQDSKATVETKSSPMKTLKFQFKKNNLDDGAKKKIQINLQDDNKALNYHELLD
jgi:hypothetical protein